MAPSGIRRLWAASGALAVVLFLCGLLFGDLLGSSNYPPLNASSARVSAYFLSNGSEVRLLALFHLLSAMALLGFVSYLHEWMERAARGKPGLPAVALAGGATAAAFLLLSALTYRVLAEATVARDGALAHALVVISYLAGGPGIAVPLALPIGCASILALRDGQLPRWSGWIGTVAVAACIGSASAMVGAMNNTSVTYGILLLAAILGFGWTLLTSLYLSLGSRALGA